MKYLFSPTELRLFVSKLKTQALKYSRFYRDWPKKDEVVMFAPGEIVGHLSAEYQMQLIEASGYWNSVILPGAWDLGLPRNTQKGILESVVYLSCSARWKKGSAWHQTPVWDLHLEAIRSGNSLDGISSLDALNSRYETLDNIFESVSKSGRLSSAPQHLTQINIGRNGELFRGPNGRHRFCIAMIAGVELMPARIGYVHPDGINKLRELRDSVVL